MTSLAKIMRRNLVFNGPRDMALARLLDSLAGSRRFTHHQSLSLRSPDTGGFVDSGQTKAQVYSWLREMMVDRGKALLN